MKIHIALGYAVCVLGSFAAASDEADAAPIVSFGGNSYEFVQVLTPPLSNFTAFPQNSWQSASAAAASSMFMAVPGHLVTITSQAENDFLFNLVSGQFTGFAGAWLGGSDPAGWLVGPESGQAFSYTNWAGVEPNNSGFAYMSIGTTNAPGEWFDDSVVPIAGDGQGIPTMPNDPVIGYFVEYEGVTVPAPPVLPLFLGALGFLGWRRDALRGRRRGLRPR